MNHNVQLGQQAGIVVSTFRRVANPAGGSVVETEGPPPLLLDSPNWNAPEPTALAEQQLPESFFSLPPFFAAVIFVSLLCSLDCRMEEAKNLHLFCTNNEFIFLKMS